MCLSHSCEVACFHLSRIMWFYVLFFKQKTAYEMRISDWSSDVCSSDLVARGGSRPRCRCTRCRRAAARCAACRVLGGKDGGSCRVSCSCGPGPLGGGPGH